MSRGWSTKGLLCLLALGGSVAFGTEIPSRSPFLPTETAAAPVTPAEAPQFLGIMMMPEETLFRLYDPVTRKGVWVRTGETGHGFVVRQHYFINGRDQILIEQNGRSLSLALPEARIATVRTPVTAASIPLSSAPPEVTQSVRLNPTPESEAARLQDVINEVQRRREARQASAQ